MAERIATSPLTGRIYAGRFNKDGTTFSGAERDTTSDVLRALADRAYCHDGQFEIEAGIVEWTVTVRQEGGANG